MTPDPDHARTMLVESRNHLETARLLVSTKDVAATFVTAYDAAR